MKDLQLSLLLGFSGTGDRDLRSAITATETPHRNGKWKATAAAPILRSVWWLRQGVICPINLDNQVIVAASRYAQQTPFG